MALLAASLCLAAGCTTAPAPDPTASIGPVRELTARETALLHDAEQILVRDCMRQHGFRYFPLPRNPVPENRSFPYVIDDVAWARRHGYGSDIQRRLAELDEADPNRRYYNSLSPAQRTAALAAINGERPVGLSARLPSGGVMARSDRSCTSAAERELYRDLPTWYRVEHVTDDVVGLWRGQVAGDPAFRAAVGRWAVCMREHGYGYTSPALARAELTRPDQPAGRDREIQVAVAEATCATSTGLAATATALDQHYASQVRRQYAPEFATRQRLELAALPRAGATVSADRGTTTQ